MAFEAILSEQKSGPTGWRRIIMTFSVLLHAIALAAGVAHSIWQVEEMPMPAVEVTLSMAPPPPPPPPPPPKRSSSTKPKTKPVDIKPKTIVAPKETPKAEPEPAEAEEEGSDDDEGEEGGQEGGVVGGVVGGIVGGTAPPPPKSVGPKLLTTKAGHSLLAINPQVRPYKVNVPEEYVQRGDEYVAQIRICVNAQGTVTSVKILRPSIPVIDVQIPQVIPKWRYKPYLVDGKPSDFCYPMNYRVR
jgi:periplasmic protein TonB